MASDMDLFLDRVVQYDFHVFLWEPLPKQRKNNRELLNKLKSERNLSINLNNYRKIFPATLLQNEFCHGTDCGKVYEKTVRDLLLTGPFCEKCTELNRKLLQLFGVIEPDLVCELCNSVFEDYNFSWAKDQRILCMKCRFTTDCGIKSNRRRCTDEKCIRCFLKSFASSHYSINCVDVNPRTISKSSSDKYSIKCPECGHVSLQTIQTISNLNRNQNACGFCYGIYMCPENNNCQVCREKSVGNSKLGTKIVKKIGMVWSIEDNKESEWEVLATTGNIYTFICRKCGHKINKSACTASLYDCKYCNLGYCCPEKNNCQICRSKSVGSSKLGDNEKYKNLTIGFQWVIEGNEISQWEVVPQSELEAVFVCRNPICGHQVKKPIYEAFKNGCGYCTGRILCPVEDNCEQCWSKSVGASHLGSTRSDLSLGLEWDVHANEQSEWETPIGTILEMYFRCRSINCGHLVRKPVCDAMITGCGYCNTNLFCKESENCDTCRKKSAGNTELSPFSKNSTGLEWVISKNNISMWEVSQNSNTTRVFICRVCKHLSKKAVYTTLTCGCGYCRNVLICKESENCEICRKKSIGSLNLHVFWDEYRNEQSKWETLPGTNRKCFWLCDKNHSWKTEVLNVCILGTGCPFCKNKTEAKLYSWLQEIKPEIMGQFKPDWARDPNTLWLRSYDFCLEEFKLLIELDGGHRWKQRSDIPKSPEEVCRKDMIKQRLAREHGYTLIRIPQMDVWTDETDWKSDLKKLFFLRRKPRLIFLATDRRYKSHHIPEHPDCQGIRPIFVTTVPIKK